MTGHEAFGIFWSAWVLIIGSFFAFRTDIAVRMNKWNLENFPLPSKLRRRMQPPSYTKVLYRAGGILFIVLGLIVGTVTVVGVLHRA